MPILDVELVLRPDEDLPANLARQIAVRAGEVFAAPPGTTWVKLRTLAATHYAENDAEHGLDVYPVFVTVLKAQLPEPAALQAEVAALTDALAEACGRPPENVHILYLPAGAGRMAFGGKLVPVNTPSIVAPSRCGARP